MAGGALVALSLSLLTVPSDTTVAEASPAPPSVTASPGLNAAVRLEGEHAASRSTNRVLRPVRPAEATQRAVRPVARKLARSVQHRQVRRAVSKKHTAHRRVHRAISRSHGRHAAWTVRTRGRAAVVVAYARRQLGKPYRWGSLDCSGLTMRAYARAGVRLPHKASRQDERGRRVPRSAARAGDLVLWGGDSAYHVGIYLGGGRVIHAPKPGDRVKVSRLWGHPYFVRVLR